ncbi:TnsA endonuclease N-terminal domain-containing protein [Ralstonia mojiangensis]|uniref:TnsA endonuclease N-terminal domain-containing protein n=1 Tax=Ralstonia mojiangensis TaxID=2953895 RepID=UPI0020912BFA|nr:TnsA endonuclease N-terminal domain-containing protein [Ralstonia mojiangensis]MCO5413300.1 TnsA endonuclease N-terminal domain-containing protein [Ralstonia mojiangensis]
MPAARKVVTRSPHRRVGLIACPWFQPNTIEYESLLERDFVRIALLDPEISSISHQPFLLNLGEFGNYVPDFLLVSPTRKLVVEVKPEERALNTKNKPRLACAERVLCERGFDFLVATEKFIRRDKRHDRAAILLRYARSQLPADLIKRVTVVASGHPLGIPIRALASEAQTSIDTVLHLIGRRCLRINEALNFDEDQVVYPSGGDDVRLHA